MSAKQAILFPYLRIKNEFVTQCCQVLIPQHHKPAMASCQGTGSFLNLKRVNGYMIEVGMSLLEDLKKFESSLVVLPRSVP